MTDTTTEPSLAKEASPRKCPICQHNLTEAFIELHPNWPEVHRKEVKAYRCDYHGEFCEHILNAKRVNINDFQCNSCFSDRIEDCDCMDCEVFCNPCNSFWTIQCSDVMSIIYTNEGEL